MQFVKIILKKFLNDSPSKRGALETDRKNTSTVVKQLTGIANL